MVSKRGTLTLLVDDVLLRILAACDIRSILAMSQVGFETSARFLAPNFIVRLIATFMNSRSQNKYGVSLFPIFTPARSSISFRDKACPILRPTSL